MRKKILSLILAVVLSATMGFTALAGQWEQDGIDYKYKNDDGTYATGTWQWIDGKSYYFDGNGYMIHDTVTPDGYTVDSDGAWVVNGEVQTRTDVGVVQTQTTGSTGNAAHSGNYDPAHPLAGKIDEWDLRLPKNYIGYIMIVNDNVQALLTGQMDQYYIPPAGYSVNPTTGTQMYVSQEDYDANVRNTQALYNWFCNWLNGMNFESMSEMEKAKEIKNVLAQGINQTGMGEAVDFRNAQYSVLIDKQGVCAEYAMTATSLAEALGLKSTVSGTGDHAVYYIQVDGKAYFGQNNVLNLNSPTPDNVFFD